MPGMFSGMFNQMFNGPNFQPPFFPNEPSRRYSQGGRDSHRPRSAPGTDREPGRPQYEIYTNNGPGFSFTATSSVRHFPSSNGSQPGTPSPMTPIQEYVPLSMPRMNQPHPFSHPPMPMYALNSMDRLLESILGIQGHQNGHGELPQGLGAIFQRMMNPGGAPQGDFATTQEAFDQILSQLMNDHQSGNAPGPASEEAIDGLPKRKVSAKDKFDGDCSICMQRPDQGEEIVTLPCNHWFHFECVQSWLKEHDTCPICREGIMPKDPAAGRSARTPGQAPLNNQDPFELVRRQSGTRDHPFIVPESPVRERRRTYRRHSSGPPRAQISPSQTRRSTRSSQTSDDERGGSGNGGGISNRVRNFFGGGGEGSSRR